MKKLILFSVLLSLAFFLFPTSVKPLSGKNKTVYDFTVNDNFGKPVKLDKYKGKVLLIVNTASECGFTKQYSGLQALHDQYASQSFEILAFPCNQFGRQEPGSMLQIVKFCTSKFSVKFPIFEKVKVNGKNAHPLYKFLKSQRGGFLTNSIKWNFTKFLINKDGKPVKRYGPTTKPKSLKKEIEKLIK